MVCLGVVDVDGVNVHFDTQALADVLDGLFDDGEGFQSEEVHLDESCVLDDAAFVLGDQHLFARFLILSSADGYPVGDVIAADDGSAGMYTGVAHVSFQHLGILDGVSQGRVGRGFCFLQFRHVGDGVGQIQFLVRYLVGHQFAQAVRFIQWEFLHTGNVLDGRFGSHGAVGDDVCHLFGSVLLCYPAENLATSVVVEVHIDIGQ